MLEITNQDYFNSVMEFAVKTSQVSQLQSKLDYLNNYGSGANKETKCLLYKDFAPNSFEFTMLEKRNGEFSPMFNGGLIYYGDGESGVGSPQFSVRLNTTGSGWSINT